MQPSGRPRAGGAIPVRATASGPLGHFGPTAIPAEIADLVSRLRAILACTRLRYTSAASGHRAVCQHVVYDEGSPGADHLSPGGSNRPSAAAFVSQHERLPEPPSVHTTRARWAPGVELLFVRPTRTNRRSCDEALEEASASPRKPVVHDLNLVRRRQPCSSPKARDLVAATCG